MSNADVIGWTIFVCLIYVRLITVRLVTEVRKGELSIGLRGLWRSRRISVNQIQAVEEVIRQSPGYNGGYGIRSTRAGKAYIASGGGRVRLRLAGGEKLVIGSERPDELANIIRASVSPPRSRN